MKFGWNWLKREQRTQKVLGRVALSQIYEVGKTDYYRGLEAKVRTYFSLKQTNFVKEIAHSSIHQLKTTTKGNDYFYVMNFFFLLLPK